MCVCGKVFKIKVYLVWNYGKFVFLQDLAKNCIQKEEFEYYGPKDQVNMRVTLDWEGI